jgi:hypothetical protein
VRAVVAQPTHRCDADVKATVDDGDTGVRTDGDEGAAAHHGLEDGSEAA